MRALPTFFGEVREGRLARMAFLAWTMLLMLLLIVLSFVLGALIGIAHGPAGASPDASWAGFEDALSTPLGLLLPLLGLVFLFAQYNLIAKRVRDIGLSGWLAVLVVFLVTGIAGATLPAPVTGAINGGHRAGPAPHPHRRVQTAGTGGLRVQIRNRKAPA